jgi:hypothetical protein
MLMSPTNVFLFLLFSASQDTCDATKSEDGSKCVWCSVATFGVCVSEDIAQKMKGQIPGLECDDDKKDDDSTDDNTDDKAPAQDDDTKPNDDSVPDDYWTCLEKYTNSTTCAGAGCAWCVSIYYAVNKSELFEAGINGYVDLSSCFWLLKILFLVFFRRIHWVDTDFAWIRMLRPMHPKAIGSTVQHQVCP